MVGKEYKVKEYIIVIVIILVPSHTEIYGKSFILRGKILNNIVKWYPLLAVFSLLQAESR